MNLHKKIKNIRKIIQKISSNDRTQKVCEDTNDWHLNAGEKNITIKFVSAKEHRGLGVSNARFKIKYSVEG